MKIGILGGTFNPPHWGHQLMAKQILEFTNLDQVWLAPCYKHTFEKDLIPAQHRLNMTRFITNSHIKTCDEEINNRFSGSSLELLDFLSQKYPKNQFSFIIGSDGLASFKKWVAWQILIKKYPFLVFPRPNFSYNLKKYGLDKPEYKFDIINHPLLTTTNLSSTLIRQRLKKNLDITNLVSQKVKKYIINYKLYV